MLRETLTAPRQTDIPEAALAGDIGAAAAILRDLVAAIDVPSQLAALAPELQRRATALAARVASLEKEATALDHTALADHTRRAVPPELHAVVGHPNLEGEML